MLIVSPQFHILAFFKGGGVKNKIFTIYNLIFYYWIPYLKDPLHDTNGFMLTFYFKFCFRCYFITPAPMKNIHISSVFYVNDSSVTNVYLVYDSVQTVTDKILFGTVHVSII